MNMEMNDKSAGASMTSRTMDRRAMMNSFARPPVIPVNGQRARFEDQQMQLFFERRMQEVAGRLGKDKHVIQCPPSTGERIAKSTTPYSVLMKEAEDKFARNSTH